MVTTAVKVGRVFAHKVGLASIDLDTGKVCMVLGEMNFVTEPESISGGAPFSGSLTGVGNGNCFRGIHGG